MSADEPMSPRTSHDAEAILSPPPPAVPPSDALLRHSHTISTVTHLATANIQAVHHRCPASNRPGRWRPNDATKPTSSVEDSIAYTSVTCAESRGRHSPQGTRRGGIEW